MMDIVVRFPASVPDTTGISAVSSASCVLLSPPPTRILSPWLSLCMIKKCPWMRHPYADSAWIGSKLSVAVIMVRRIWRIASFDLHPPADDGFEGLKGEFAGHPCRFLGGSTVVGCRCLPGHEGVKTGVCCVLHLLSSSRSSGVYCCTTGGVPLGGALRLWLPHQAQALR
jgi:hypothetical protein